MTVCGRFLLLVILGKIFWSGRCEVYEWGKPFNETVVQAACSLECFDEPCMMNCTGNPKDIIRLNEEAKADVRLVCRGVIYVVLAHNPGLFVIETLHGDLSSWHPDPVVSNATEMTTAQLTIRHSARTQFRLYRISTSGISIPETTEFMNQWPLEYQPKHVTNITIERIVAENKFGIYSWRVDLSFTPSEDRPCHYEVTCKQDDGPYNQMVTLERMADFNVTFERLPFAANFKLTIKSLTIKLIWDHFNDVKGTIATFSTPRCRNLSDPESCLPKAIKGLIAIATHKTGNIFDVHLTWDEPEDDDVPYNYSIDIQPIGGGTEVRLSRQIGANVTHFVFRNVKIIDQYDVYIAGINLIGKGPTISKRFTTGLKQTDVPEDIRMPIYLTITILITVIGIAAYGYFRLRKRKLNKINNKPVDEFEMSPERLTITRVLGTGAFGVVKFGTLHDDQKNIVNVAVKMLQDDSNKNERRNFLHEIKIMKAMDEHPNIISLLGCNTTGPYPFLVVEYCSRGDLQSFLRKSLEEGSMLSENETMKRIVPFRKSPRRKEILQANSRSLSVFRNRDNYVEAGGCPDELDTNSDSEVVTMMDMLNFGRQIATGMQFLSSNRIVHRDLAARNILVCSNRTVKISDFGLSRDIYKENIYKKSGNGRMPLKWMAIEALTHQIYTTYSDVWSFGVLLWEIVTLGGDPYPGVPTIEILNRLQSGYRMPRPANCSLPLYNVMLSCWQMRSKNRPTFTILRQELDKLIGTATNNEYFDLNDVFEETPPEDDDTQVSGPCPTFWSPQVASANDLEPRIITEV